MSWITDSLPALTRSDPKALSGPIENSSEDVLVMTTDGQVFRAWYSNYRKSWVRPSFGPIEGVEAWWQEDDDEE